MTPKPIETEYAGHRFRSRLEARWAVFFDHVGIKWAYETQGFNLPSGPYLPDFEIEMPRGPAWFEVKPGKEPLGDDDPRWGELAIATDRYLYVSGDIPDPRDAAGDQTTLMLAFYSNGSDCWHRFCICPKCDAVGIEFSGRYTYLDCCWTRRDFDGRSADHPRLVAAYTAARSARFEHGEVPS